MFSLLAAGSTLLASLLVSASAAPAPPPGGATSVRVVGVNGSGCANGTGAAKAAPNRRSFTVTYPGIEVSGAGDALDFRKNCQLALDVDVPRGYTYALSRIAHRGLGELPAGTTAEVSTLYYFQGEPEDVELANTLHGPLLGKWQRNNEIKPALRRFLPCGPARNLNVNIMLKVGPGGALTTDGRVVVEFARKKC